jgi:sugar/nucleoside kinase (ribokinase family)
VTGRIVCVGHLMIDVVAELRAELAHGSDTPAAVTLRSGGSAANTAAWCAEAGGAACFVGRVGADALGRSAVAELRAGGVDIAVVVDPDAPTGTCIVLVDRAGERSMIPSPGANARLVPGDLPPLHAGDHLHLSGYLLLDPATVATAAAALGRAEAAGASISVDASSAQPLRAAGAVAFLAALPREALVLANAEEAEVLTGHRDPAAAARALGRRFAAVVVKTGPAGAVLATVAGVHHIPAEPVRAVDTTGAGDAFAAGVLVARQHGRDWAAAVGAGVRLGAQAASRTGARPGSS